MDASSDLLKQEQLEQAILALQKPHELRNPEDLRLLVQLTETVTFFQRLPQESGPETHLQCCTYLRYQYVKSGEVIFEQGSIGTTFYIILKGSVGVYINQQVPKPGAEPEMETVRLEVKVLEAGMAFGELALLQKKPRAATVVAKEDCHLAVLENEDFSKILRAREEKRMQENVKFFAEVKMFAKMSYFGLQKVYLQSVLKNYELMQGVYEEGDASEEVYVVKSGEFKMVKNIEVENESDLQEPVNNNHPKTVEVAILTIGEMFGEEDIAQGVNRQMGVVCASVKGELYCIDKRVLASIE